MNIKEKLREMFDYYYEFETELEDHEIPNSSFYRLYYMYYSRTDERKKDNVRRINWPFQPFQLPDKMSKEDAFKVLSYLTDFIERDLKLVPCSWKSVANLDEVLNLKRLGFKRQSTELPSNNTSCVDLFTVSGRILLFKKSPDYERYFEWYTEGVTLSEVQNIYSKCGMEFHDLERIQDSNNSQLVKKR